MEPLSINSNKMSFYSTFVEILRESEKTAIRFSSKLQWYNAKLTTPDDCRPVFVVHTDSYKSPGKIAYYFPGEGWYKIIEKKTKIKIKTPKRWCEALIPETYEKFVSSQAPQVEPDKDIEDKVNNDLVDVLEDDEYQDNQAEVEYDRLFGNDVSSSEKTANAKDILHSDGSEFLSELNRIAGGPLPPENCTTALLSDPSGKYPSIGTVIPIDNVQAVAKKVMSRVLGIDPIYDVLFEMIRHGDVVILVGNIDVAQENLKDKLDKLNRPMRSTEGYVALQYVGANQSNFDLPDWVNVDVSVDFTDALEGNGQVVKDRA